MKTYQQLWQSLTPLYDAGEAQAIVRTVLDVKYGMTLTDIICGKVNEISADEERKLEEIIIRLQKGEPVQYVLGEADFAGRPFHVEPGVLIPRPETAELCQWIEKDMIEKSIVSSGDSSENSPEDSPEDSSGNSPQATDDARLILDICTGSGCIAITLGLNIPNSEVTGWDISEDALRIAQGNVEMMKAGNVRIEHQDALALPKAAETDNEKMKGNDDKEVVKPKGKAKTPSTQKWDLIVSNPPYICEKEKADMEKNVLEHEPSLALFVPDEDPLKFYRAIAEYASSALKSGRALYFEINPIYEKETREMLLKLDFKDIETKEDAFGKKRMMRAMK
ncbi:MAG: peptide chain release factor N(5)-glutamine methyltransferase [Prevotella copri]|nr:peptide chain release factor N(5)-glutamine methyltransferase [Segatella copri]